MKGKGVMPEPTIQLDRRPGIEDFEAVTAEALKPCHCTAEQRAGLVNGTEVVCSPCGARQTLNGIASLADLLK